MDFIVFHFQVDWGGYCFQCYCNGPTHDTIVNTSVQDDQEMSVDDSSILSFPKGNHKLNVSPRAGHNAIEGLQILPFTWQHILFLLSYYLKEIIINDITRIASINQDSRHIKVRYDSRHQREYLVRDSSCLLTISKSKDQPFWVGGWDDPFLFAYNY